MLPKGKRSPSKNKAFVFIILSGIILPFIARIPGVFLQGIDYLSQYISSAILITVFNVIPFIIFAVINQFVYSRDKEAVIGAGVALFISDLFMHASVDLQSTSTAGIAIIFIPFWLCVAMVIGYVLGYFVGLLRRSKNAKAGKQ